MEDFKKKFEKFLSENGDNVSETEKNIIELISEYYKDQPSIFIRSKKVMDLPKGSMNSALAAISGNQGDLKKLIRNVIEQNADIEELFVFAIIDYLQNNKERAEELFKKYTVKFMIDSFLKSKLK